MRNKDLIFVSNMLANGGAARVLTNLASHYVQEGYKVGILVFNSSENEYSVPDGVEKIYGPTGNGRLDKLKRLFWIRRVIRSNPKAVVVAFEYFVNLFALMASIGCSNRIIVSERNDPERVGNSFFLGRLRSLVYRRADTLVCQTKDAAEFFSNRITTTIILNPLKHDLPVHSESTRRKSIVSFGRLEQQKNLDMLVQAFSKFYMEFPDFTLEIYGEGRERERLEHLRESLSLTGCVIIEGARDDIHRVVKDASMFVLPSDYEGLSNSMLEAMAMGLPVICTDCPCGGAKTVIRDGVNGILIPVGDSNSLLNAMRKVASETDYATSLGRNALKIRGELSMEMIAQQWDEVIFGESRK